MQRARAFFYVAAGVFLLALKKTLLISGLLLALTASVASAGGINLSWNDCVEGGGAQDATFACNTNTGTAGTLYASFVPNFDQTLCAFEFVIDVQSAGAALPEWWKFKAAGTCRQASMTMNTNFTTGPFGCVDSWHGQFVLQDFNYLIGHSGPNTARIWGGGEIHCDTWEFVDTGVEYYCFALIINRAKTVDTGSCPGCSEPVCLVFNELRLYDPLDRAWTSLNAPAQRNYVTWQGGGIGDPAGCPLATPTTKATWGRIKALYR